MDLVTRRQKAIALHGLLTSNDLLQCSFTCVRKTEHGAEIP